MNDNDVEPQVTGLSPKEGKEGTKITIRGQNLGKDKHDLKSVIICNLDCTRSAEWVSPNKIICVSGPAIGKGDVIVTTRSGGRGTCTVKFTGIREIIDPLKPSSKWVEDPPSYVEEIGGIDEAPIPGYSYQDYDPLGIAVDEARVGRNRLPEQVESLYPEGSGDITSENFVPAWYLLEKHRFTNFEDLKAGMDHLEGEVEKRAPGTTGFIKRNLSNFIQCFDTLSDVNGLLIRTDSQQEAGSITDKLEQVLQDTSTEGEKIFNSVLNCKRRADITRNALNVLQRYRFLFNLPKNIEMNIKNGEYEIVANDFARARSLFDGTKVEVFKRVLSQVESQVADFRKDLMKKLYTLPSTLADQKKTIKYLLELDCEGDPAWDCITNMCKGIVRLLQSSKDEFQSQLTSNTGDSSGLLNVSVEINESKGHSRSFSDGSSGWKGGDQGGRPKSILFVEELTGLISENLPDLWKLGQTYLNKTLFQGVTLMSEEQQRMAEACPLRKNEFEEMVYKVIELYSDMVHVTFFPNEFELLPEARQKNLGHWVNFNESLQDSLAAWLPLCVRQLRTCLSSFVSLSLPQNVLSCCSRISISMRGLCAEALFIHGTEDIALLHEREDWRVQAEDSGCITSLPLLFENIVVEVLITLKEVVIENQPGESHDCNERLKWKSTDYFQGMLRKFVDTLEYLAFQQEEDLHTEMIMKAGSRDHLNNSSEALNEEETGAPSDEQRLMMILSNCLYVRTQVVPRLLDCFRSHGYPPSKEVENVVLEDLTRLDQKVFMAYISKKTDPIEEILAEALDVDNFEYDRSTLAKDVPGYVQEVLLNLVLVHHEVYSISPISVQRVLSSMLESISNAVYHRLNEVGEFTDNSAVNAHIELSVFESVLQPYLTKGSYRDFKLANGLLGRAPGIQSQYVKQIVDKFKKKTDLQLKCFSI